MICSNIGTPNITTFSIWDKWKSSGVRCPNTLGYATQCLNLIYIAIKFHYHIPKDYLVMGCANIVLKINQRDITPKLSKKKGSHSCMRHAALTLCILISSFIMMFHSLT